MNEHPWPPSAPPVRADFNRAANPPDNSPPDGPPPPPGKPPEGPPPTRPINDNPRLVLTPSGVVTRGAPSVIPPPLPAPQAPAIDPERRARIDKMREGLRASDEFNKVNQQGRAL